VRRRKEAKKGCEGGVDEIMGAGEKRPSAVFTSGYEPGRVETFDGNVRDGERRIDRLLRAGG